MRATPDGMKVCSKCRKNREIVWFSKKKTKVDGLQVSCKECVRSYMKSRNHKMKETHWQTILMSGTKTCSKCKENKDIVEFSPDLTKKSGRASNCKRCHVVSSVSSQIKRYEKDPEFYLFNRNEIARNIYRRGGWVAQREYKYHKKMGTL